MTFKGLQQFNGTLVWADLAKVVYAEPVTHWRALPDNSETGLPRTEAVPCTVLTFSRDCYLTVVGQPFDVLK